MAKRDYYEVLGLSRNATDDEIKRAFRRLAKQLHPDQNKGDKDAESKFKEAQEAYAVLSDKQKRAQYDRFGHDGTTTTSFHPGGASYSYSTGGETINIEDLADIFDFSSFFGGGGGRGRSGPMGGMHTGGGRRNRAPQPEPAADVEFPVSLTFDRAIHGTTIELEQPTPDGGRQRISVAIPAGVRDGQKVRVRGKGSPGRGRRPPGDLYVVVHIQPHPYFERRDDDIYLTVPITVAESALGAKVDVPTLDGRSTVTIPPGTPSGAKLRLGGLGVQNTVKGTRGDQYVLVKIVPPRPMSEEQKRLFEELRKLDTASPRDGLW